MWVGGPSSRVAGCAGLELWWPGGPPLGPPGSIPGLPGAASPGFQAGVVRRGVAGAGRDGAARDALWVERGALLTRAQVVDLRRGAACLEGRRGSRDGGVVCAGQRE